MASKKNMASTKKPAKKVGKVLEFIRAISAFWPVWMSTVVIIVGVFGFQFYQQHVDINEENKTAIKPQVSIHTRQVKVVGELKYIKPIQIKKLVSENLSSGFLASDLMQIKSFVEAEPWVKSATVKRLPPDILQLHIEEQKPILRWGNKGLISIYGDVFEPSEIGQFENLATIVSEKESIGEGLELLTQSISVLKKLQLNLEKISEDSLGAWEIKTTQGVLLKLGRKKLKHRLKILEKLWPKAIKKGSLKIVDLRYANGAAVSYL